MKEISIHLRPLPSSPWITHDAAFGTSIVSIKDEAAQHPGPLTIVGVRLNGLPLRHRVIDASTVVVRPCIPLQGDRLEVRCIGPQRPQAALQWSAPAYPLPMESYGLQRPTDAAARNLQ